MSTNIKLLKCLLSRIEAVKVANSSGQLYGLTQNNAILVLGFSLNQTIENHLPIGFKELGRIEWQNDATVTSNGVNDAIENTNVVHLIWNLQSADQPLTVSAKNKSNEWKTVTYDIVSEEELWKEWSCLRTKFTLKFRIENPPADNYQMRLKQLLNEAKVKLLESHKPMVKIDGTEIVLKKDKGLIGIGKNGKVSAAILQAKKNENATEKDANGELKGFECLNCVLKPSDEDATSDDINAVFANCSLHDSVNATEIDFDALALVRNSMGANQLYEIVLKSIERNFVTITANVKSVERPLRTFVFYPKELGHLISYVYPTSPANDDEEEIVQRKQNHTNLNLLRPCLRRGDVYSFEARSANGLHLINPHVGLKSLVKNGKQYVVKGDYAYQHYMQDNFNDDGWGCAYRSFQTLFSWYRLQAYTTKPVPTHAQIQQCLIDLGDKPKTFLNSRQWIGSTEVAMCLQYFLDVDSRIVHVTSGSEMAQHGPTFAQHFTTYGTPVMIGGGVLAHTILGVDYNSETNELKFLVLDPHYTGADELDVVQKKGWCAWKPVTFWDKKSYYNFCMPLFPNAAEY